MTWLPEGVLRAKGFVYLAEDLGHRHLLQRVGQRWTLTCGQAWGEASPGTTLVFIGVPGSVESAEIEKRLAASNAVAA